MGRSRMKAVAPNLVDSLLSQPNHPAEPEPIFEGETPPASVQPGELGPPPEIDSREFEVSFGESLDRTLDLDTWNDGKDLNAIFGSVLI
jgi:hypothetical protein